MTDQDRNRYTPPRLRQPALDPMASYASGFGPDALKRIEEDLYYFYREEDLLHLQERLEFSLSLDSLEQPVLRYVLFRLFDPGRIIGYFKNHGHPGDGAGRMMDVMGPVTPEFAIGNDFSPGKERLKLYSMRLDSLQNRMPEVISATEQLSEKMGVPFELPNEVDPADLTVVATDFHLRSRRRDLKIYTVLPKDSALTASTMSALPLGSRYQQELSEIREDDPQGEFLDCIQCFRFSNTAEGLSGYSLYTGFKASLWPRVESILHRISPEQFPQIRRHFGRVEARGWNISPMYVGSSFRLPGGEEKVHLYFSVI